jgi:hypothetical protein
MHHTLILFIDQDELWAIGYEIDFFEDHKKTNELSDSEETFLLCIRSQLLPSQTVGIYSYMQDYCAAPFHTLPHFLNLQKVLW